MAEISIARKDPIPIPDSPEEYKKAVKKAYSDIKFFTEKIMGYTFPKHYSIWYSLMKKHNRLVVLAHRSSGKTVFFSYIYPLWVIFRGDCNEILIIASIAQESSRILERLRTEIETNPWLKHLENKRGTWTTRRFVTKPDKVNSRGIEVSSMGLKSAKRGRHPQLIIIDDLLQEQNNMPMNDVRYKFNYVILNMLSDDNAKLYMVGTPISFDDIYTDLKDNPKFKVAEFPALDENGNPLWKEFWTLEKLDAKREEITPTVFAKEYLLKPVSPDTAVIKAEYIQEAARKLAVLGTKPKNPLYTVIGVDFAFSEAKRADFTVITVVSKVRSTYKVVDVWRKKGTSMSEIQEVLASFWERYDADVIIAEDTGQQKGVVKMLQDAGFYVLPIKVTRYTKNDIIGRLIFEFEKKRIAIPANKGSKKTLEYYRVLSEELTGLINVENRYKSVARHDDTVMSLAFCIYYMVQNEASLGALHNKMETVDKKYLDEMVSNYEDNEELANEEKSYWDALWNDELSAIDRDIISSDEW
ncbi:MAG: phage terminase large subunit family protein [Candidatus Heimdallarchaeaceae archaeon]